MLAHRGLALEAPENTLLAFLAAVGLGIDHVETDVHASKDGVAVISHDPDLRRVAGVDGRVGDLSLARLQKVDLGRDQTFCTLAEALDAFPDARFNIDIKSADAVGPTVRAIRDLRAVDRVLVTSFSESRRRAAVRELPGVATSASSSVFAAALVAGKLRAAPLLRAALRGVDAVQIPESYRGVSIVTERMVELLHSAKVEVHVWTVNDAPAMHRLLDIGVDGIVTDRADIALGVLTTRAR
ncbi:glycerophosphoryl diester phosphodiesterase [Conyzicola lurida]|uniref:Glycerophosphoryl diester phosphodiesterase n=1 Tax=Conyzicola lurida TaxID=1172621 RepID=A0A841AM06_9MICO|nr:glycerophosphoryl diester phosphodiesterase [Conyzicola lurida]